MNKIRVLLRNAMRTPDGTVLESRHYNDYRIHIDRNGEEYMIDGGLDYISSSVNKEPAKSLIVYNDDPHERVRELLLWGTYGINGDQPLEYVALKDMSEDRIKNAITFIYNFYGDHVILPNEDYARVQCMQNELGYRKKENF